MNISNNIISESIRSITTEYFDNNKNAKDEVIKAFFAYHTYHPRHHEGAHHFDGPYRDCHCLWCGRSREMVRWDDLPAQCQNRPNLPDISATIKNEEEKAFLLLKRAVNDVPKIIAKLGMSGKTLAILHHTHGYDPEIVDSVVSVPPQMMSDYYSEMEVERNRSRNATVREIITVRSTEDLGSSTKDYV